MIVETMVFYLFSAIMIASAVMVISTRNPVHSVLFLILTFFNAAALFMLTGAEFLAMILVVVYVGAVAVLFLFVVMMLDINFVELRQGFMQYLPAGALIGAILLIELAFFSVGHWVSAPDADAQRALAMPAAGQVSNTLALGRVLYTDYAYLFQLAGLILLVAMIGAIVLTLRQRAGVKKQSIADQVSRSRGEAIEIKDVPTGSGV
ncbi:MAG: NADH-quinone oxidoreductase subunit J [Rhodospirillales bacterium]|nr:NADH-quinone oxidoreductase subunit J [Rhodospirillales bacterium]